jgi:hypothetical protein
VSSELTLLCSERLGENMPTPRTVAHGPCLVRPLLTEDKDRA